MIPVYSKIVIPMSEQTAYSTVYTVPYRHSHQELHLEFLDHRVESTILNRLERKNDYYV